MATPVSPWSVFNLVRWNPEASAPPIAPREADATPTPVPPRSDGTAGPDETNVAAPRVTDSEPVALVADLSHLRVRGEIEERYVHALRAEHC